MCTCSRGDLYLAGGACQCGQMTARPCNVGPVPSYDNMELENMFAEYIANCDDSKCFELGSYSTRQKGDHVDIYQIAALGGLLKRLRLSKDPVCCYAHVVNFLHVVLHLKI